MSWEQDQEFERSWWNDCANTFVEETKQLTYAYKMGLTCYSDYGKWPCYNLEGKNILDIGGGPVSILLKSTFRGNSCVVDPCKYPDWVKNRYEEIGIRYSQDKGEDLIWDDNNHVWKDQWDEVWIYNVLQHVQDPELIIQNSQNLAPTIRIFEWIDLAPHEGHPHELKEADLNKWLGGEGTVELLDENHCYGKAYYGIFIT